jgi:hypothetical protein
VAKDDSKKFGAQGGKARAKRLTAEERSEIAREGARAKWAKEGVQVKTMPKALYGSDERPLRVGDIEIPCFVLDDGRRVLAQSGMLTALNMKSGSAGKKGRGRTAGDRLANFVATQGVAQFIAPETAGVIVEPILFTVPDSPNLGYGFEATVLADLCDAVLEARKAGKLNYQQEHIAERCEILVRAFARVGIIALVDEATGYQEVREKQALAEILEKFISKELRKWARRFPFAFYENIFRLKGWDASELTPNSPKPLEVGKITDDLVYKRLAPGVRAELKKLTPRNEKGFLTHRLHQHLTDEIGNPKLEKHIAVLMALMDVSPNWQVFMGYVNRQLPRFDKTMELPFDGPGPIPARALPSASRALSDSDQ